MKALAAMSGSALWRAESQRRRCKCPEKEIGCAGWRSSSRSLFRRAVSAFSLRGWRVPVMCMRGGTTPVVVTENSKILAYGGRSRIGDSTRMNEITLSGTYDDLSTAAGRQERAQIRRTGTTATITSSSSRAVRR